MDNGVSLSHVMKSACIFRKNTGQEQVKSQVNGVAASCNEPPSAGMLQGIRGQALSDSPARGPRLQI